MSKRTSHRRAALAALTLTTLVIGACTNRPPLPGPDAGSTTSEPDAGPSIDSGADSGSDAGLDAGSGGAGGAGGPLFQDVTATLPSAPAAPRTMEARAADLDGDGDIDLFLAREGGANALLLNDGTAHFSDASDRIPQIVHDHEDIAITDLDGDGDLDIVIASEDDQAKELYLNDGKGFFMDASSRLPQMGVSNAVVAADLDGDGDRDLIFGCAGAELLLINDGKGFFTDETAQRFPVADDVTQDVAAADIDGDGDLDLAIGNEGGNRLLLNDGTGHFTDVTAAQLPPPKGLMEETRNADFGDVDGDGDLDLYFSNVAFQPQRSAQDRLLINDGKGSFTDQTDSRVPVEKRWTMDSDFADVDGDGDLDLVQAIVPANQRYRLLINDGKGVLTDRTAELMPASAVGEGIEVEVADFDGDGRPDLYLTGYKSPDRLLLRR